MTLVTGEPMATPDGTPTGTVTEATSAELAKLGQADTPNGRLALVVAQRIDAGQEPGGALAQLVKSHREVMAAVHATANAQTEDEQPNLLEQIRIMRERRLAGDNP